jgi:DNA (cytosine-5)-methyltransferase 1
MRGNGDGENVNTLTGDHAGRPTDSTPVVVGGPSGSDITVFDTTQITSKANRSNPKPGDPSHTLSAHAHVPIVAGTLQSNGRSAGSATQQDAESGLHVTHSLRGEGFDASEDGTGRGTPLVPVPLDPGAYLEIESYSRYGETEAKNGSTQEGNPAEILRTLRKEIGEEAFEVWRSRVSVTFQPEEVLRQAMHGSSFRRSPSKRRFIFFDRSLSCQKAFNQRPVSDVWQYWKNRCPPQGWKLAQQRPGEFGKNLQKLSSESPFEKGSMSDLWQAPEGSRILHEALSEIQKARKSKVGKKESAYGFGVRRLTPVETERLQGLPDNYTRIPWRGQTEEACPDGPRYKAIGNAMATVVMLWIGRRIKMIHEQRSLWDAS